MNKEEKALSEKIENENVENKETEEKKAEVKVEENTNKKKNMKTRTIAVIVAIAIFLLGSFIVYRANYLETLEIGEGYEEVFNQNVRYKLSIGVINFICIYFLVCITNRMIKKGLKKFFEEEKKEMPKLPSKSLALIIGLVTSLVVSNLFLYKVILFTNTAWFGQTDPVYGVDLGFYMFQAPLIRTIIILWIRCYNYANSIYNCILYYSF